MILQTSNNKIITSVQKRTIKKCKTAYIWREELFYADAGTRKSDSTEEEYYQDNIGERCSEVDGLKA